MIVSRVLASLAHLALVVGLLGIGWRHFERPHHGHGDGRMLLVAPLYPDGSGRQWPAHPVGPDRRGGVLALTPGPGRGPDRTGRRLAPRLPGTDRPLVRVLSRPRGHAVCHGRGGRRRRLRHRRATGGAWEIGRAPSEPAASPKSVSCRSSSPGPTSSFWVSIDSSFRLPVLILYFALVIIFSMSAGRQEPGRADRSLGRIARRQPVLVSRQGGRPGDALPAAGDRHDVSADAHDPQAAVARTPAPRDPAFALPVSLTHQPSNPRDRTPTTRVGESSIP